MKIFIPIVLFCLITFSTFAQCETRVYDNGLIYSEDAMEHMRGIVDSIHAKYQQSGLDQDYYSLPQAIAHCIQFDKEHEASIVDAIKSGMDFDEFMSVYGDSLWAVRKNLVTTKTKFGRNQIQLSGFDLKTGDHINIYIPNNRAKSLTHTKGKWIRNYYTAFYFTEDLAIQKIPKKYARMIQYVDAMIDTNQTVFSKPKRLSNPFVNGLDTLSDQYVFLRLIERIEYPNKPKKVPAYPYAPYNRYKDSLKIWKCAKAEYILANIAPSPSFQAAAEAAYQEAIHEKLPTRALENAIAFFYSKKKALEIKRSYSVYNYCGGDNSSSWHRFSITRLAAETGAWDIFMRGHLNMLHSQLIKTEGRGSYLKEVEELGIDSRLLLLGIALKSSNVHENHYTAFFNPGKALAETSEPEALEKLMAKMILDKKLDAYNRVAAYLIYRTYIEHLQDEDRKAAAQERLLKIARKGPYYIKEKIGME